MRALCCAMVVVSLAAGTALAGPASAKKAASVKAAAMTEDIYVEIKAHEAAFLSAAFRDQSLELGTQEQQQAALEYAQRKQDEFGVVKRKLLAGYGVAEKDFDAYENKLTGESWNQIQAGMKDIDLTDLKLEQASGMIDEKARRIAERIADRAQELDSKQLYK